MTLPSPAPDNTQQPDTLAGQPQAENKAAQALEEAANQQQLSLVSEFILFLRENKAWWLVPILLALALLFVAAWFSSSAAAPFIYPLF